MHALHGLRRYRAAISIRKSIAAQGYLHRCNRLNMPFIHPFADISVGIKFFKDRKEGNNMQYNQRLAAMILVGWRLNLSDSLADLAQSVLVGADIHPMRGKQLEDEAYLVFEKVRKSGLVDQANSIGQHIVGLCAYVDSCTVAELYDDDADFADALNNLIIDFEYPNVSHMTVGQVKKMAFI